MHVCAAKPAAVEQSGQVRVNVNADTKVAITTVENGVAVFSYAGNTHRVPLTGKYSCACESGGACCDIISQRPVQCGCGKEMKEIKQIK